MDNKRADEIRAVLRLAYPGASVTVDPDPGGARISISGISTLGAAQLGDSGEVRMSVGNDGPVLTMLLTGRIAI